MRLYRKLIERLYLFTTLSSVLLLAIAACTEKEKLFGDFYLVHGNGSQLSLIGPQSRLIVGNTVTGKIDEVNIMIIQYREYEASNCQYVLIDKAKQTYKRMSDKERDIIVNSSIKKDFQLIFKRGCPLNEEASHLENSKST